MKRFTKYASAFLLLTASFTLAANSPAKAWDYSSGEEDWGPTCYVTQPHSKNGNITILSSEGEFNPAMLISLPRYPRNTRAIPVSFQFGDGTQFTINATIDDYFGNLYLNLNRAQLDSFIYGRSLNITVARRTNISVSLNNSEPALNDFLRCAQGTSGSSGGQTATTGEWTALSDIGPGWEPGPNPIDEIQYRLSDKGYVEPRGRLYLKDADFADRSGGNNIYRVLMRLPTLQGKQYTFNHYDNVRTERQGVGYGQAHRMELNVYDNQLVFPHTEVQNPSQGTPDSVTLFGLRIPVE
ncbi:MAG: hypothetical protein JKY99_04000 [Rhizobiales bacterium]|nr:hypothetical protein [Hyphomicrobiales bacterium]